MDFPHIDDSSFPHLNNVDVYKYKNEFDYARWQGKATYKLINVRWNSSYSDVPYFETDKKRDEWFDTQEGYAGILESVFNNTPETSLKIPIPYNVAYEYNYLVVDMPVQTSIDNQINYENANDRVSRWYFFIEDMIQSAPNTTELELSVDYWTSFANQIDIPYLMLERGHAPMTKTSVAEYLSNPIYNNEFLLADDFNFGNETIIKTSTYKPIGNGTKYVLFCAPYKQSDFANFGGVAYSGSSTPPTFSDLSSRWGYQLQVNDYEWKYGDSDYSSADLPISNEITNGILNGCNCYAIAGSQAQAFFNDCAKNCVNFIHGIKALFILDESLFTKGTSFTFRNKTIYPVTQKLSNQVISFNKAQFGFDAKYAEITKLYTSPYSILEVTDDNGNIFSAKIENCSTLTVHSEISIVYPFLNYNVFLSGVNGDGTMQYIWKEINGTEDSKTMWASDFSKFMMNWKIPTYSIFVSAKDEYAANNFFGNRAKRAGAIKDYENAVRYANTAYENVDDSMQTNTDNVSATNATNVTNVAADGTTLVTNTGNSTTAMVNNVAADMTTLVDNTTDAGTVAEDVRLYRSTHQYQILNHQNTKIATDTTIANSSVIQTTSTRNDYMATSYGNTGASQIQVAGLGMIGSMGSGLASGGLTGALAGGINGCVSIAQTGTSVSATGANIIAAIGTDAAIAALTTQCNDAYAQNAQLQNENILDQNVYIDAYTVTENKKLLIRQNDRTAATNNADAGRTKTAQDTNAGNTRDTNNANAVRTQTTNNANAVRTQNTETANADYTRDATVEAEKANLIQKQLEVANTYENAKLQSPHQQGEYSGDFLPDVYERRGIRFNVRTQTTSAIAQAGDAMLRFGYALHRTWDMSLGFHYGKHFTFWRAEDIWINDGEGVANVAVNTISAMFMKGVTIWRDPEEIGRVSIYDNL